MHVIEGARGWMIPSSQANVRGYVGLNINWRTDLPHHHPRLEIRQKQNKQKTFYANINIKGD